MNWFDKLWVGSRKIGFIPTALCSIVWLVDGAFVARAVATFLGQYPRLGLVAVCFVAVVVGVGGLISFWLIADHIDFLRLGYRLNWVAGDEWLYEQRYSKVVRALPCVREIVGDGYPAPCEVRIPSESSWERVVPTWASGRRAEITERIAHSFGADAGGHVKFVDA